MGEFVIGYLLIGWWCVFNHKVHKEKHNVHKARAMFLTATCAKGKAANDAKTLLVFSSQT